MAEVFHPYGPDPDRLAPAQTERPRAILWVALAVVTLFLLCLYVLFRMVAFLNPGYGPVDRVASVLLLASEGFIFLHAFGYLLSILKARRRYTITEERVLAAYQEPDVAVLVTSFNEAPEVLEETLAAVAGLDYRRKGLYLVDDSTRPEALEGAQALAARYGFTLVHRTNRRGYKAGAINDLIPRLPETYLLILDADCRPVANLLRDTIPLLEEDPRLGFVQTPQFYEGTERLPVAFASGVQQAVFYEYICEGKSTSGAMFCCGTNVVFRRQALQSIGRRVEDRVECFDESSVTEDFATSLLMHQAGWRSLYYNRVYAYGMGPETLAAYFTQQMRWALGTLGIFRRLLGEVVRRPRSLTLSQWWEYLLSSTYYFVGWANFWFVLMPVFFLIFDVRPFITDPKAYLAAFVPYFVSSLFLFYTSMGQRGYRVRHLWLGQALGFSTLWVYMRAAVAALLGRKRAFGVTPKGVGGQIPLRSLWAHLTLLLLSYIAGFWGLMRVVFLGHGAAMLVNVFWAWYHVALLAVLFLYFNRPVEVAERPPLFERYLSAGPVAESDPGRAP